MDVEFWADGAIVFRNDGLSDDARVDCMIVGIFVLPIVVVDVDCINDGASVVSNMVGWIERDDTLGTDVDNHDGYDDSSPSVWLLSLPYWIVVIVEGDGDDGVAECDWWLGFIDLFLVIIVGFKVAIDGVMVGSSVGISEGSVEGRVVLYLDMIELERGGFVVIIDGDLVLFQIRWFGFLVNRPFLFTFVGGTVNGNGILIFDGSLEGSTVGSHDGTTVGSTEGVREGYSDTMLLDIVDGGLVEINAPWNSAEEDTNDGAVVSNVTNIVE